MDTVASWSFLYSSTSSEKRRSSFLTVTDIFPSNSAILSFRTLWACFRVLAVSLSIVINTRFVLPVSGCSYRSPNLTFPFGRFSHHMISSSFIFGYKNSACLQDASGNDIILLFREILSFRSIWQVVSAKPSQKWGGFYFIHPN